MTRVASTRTAVTATGYNLTDSTDFDELATGSGNGAEVPYRTGDILVLRNGTGSPATFTIDIPQPSDYSGKGVVIPDIEVAVADGKDYLYPVSSIMKQTDGDIYIDCDVAGEILALVIGA